MSGQGGACFSLPTGHEIVRGFASTVTARFGAIGSDQSHDRKGVTSHKSTKPRGLADHLRRQS